MANDRRIRGRRRLRIEKKGPYEADQEVAQEKSKAIPDEVEDPPRKKRVAAGSAGGTAVEKFSPGAKAIREGPCEKGRTKEGDTSLHEDFKLAAGSSAVWITASASNKNSSRNYLKPFLHPPRGKTPSEKFCEKERLPQERKLEPSRRQPDAG